MTDGSSLFTVRLPLTAPLTRLEAERRLALAASSEECVRILAGFVRPHAEYLACFVVREDAALGRFGVGQGPSSERVAATKVRLERASQEGMASAIAQALGRPVGSRPLLLPVRVAGELALYIYADRSLAPFDRDELTRLGAFAASVGAQLARLAMRADGAGSAGSDDGEDETPAPSFAARLPRETPLPTVVVDTHGEYTKLVAKVSAAADPDGAAETALVRAGRDALPALFEAFPGPVTEGLGADLLELPRASECGPVLRVLSRQRRVALQATLAELAGPNRDRRFWAAHLLAELPYLESVADLVDALATPDLPLRRAALRALAAVGTMNTAATVEALRPHLLPGVPGQQRRVVVEALAGMRAKPIVPILLELLRDDDARVVRTASRGLVDATGRSFGADLPAWESWWAAHRGRSRIEWLMEAIASNESEARRRLVLAELVTLSGIEWTTSGPLDGAALADLQAKLKAWWKEQSSSIELRG
jgi:hypothetical protein